VGLIEGCAIKTAQKTGQIASKGGGAAGEHGCGRRTWGISQTGTEKALPTPRGSEERTWRAMIRL